RPVQGADRVGTLAWKHEVMLPEDVKAAFEVASPFARVLAFLLDTLLIMGVILAMFMVGMMVIAATAFSGPPWITLVLMLLTFFLVNVGYFFLFEGVLSGQTPGKY